MSRSYNFVYTLNNYTTEEVLTLESIPCRYHVMGYETAPTTGTRHIQGYISFKCQRRLPAVIKEMPRAHWEIRKGTHEQAAEYSKKGGNFKEIGEPLVTKKELGETEKQRWKNMITLAKEGDLSQLEEYAPREYVTFLAKWKSMKEQDLANLGELENEWHWGPTGTGKSRYVREKYPDAYIKTTNKWWDGYAGESVVIIEEWSPEHDKLLQHLKQWADHYPFRAEIKGGSMMIRPKKIIVTSNYEISACAIRTADSDPLYRRFKSIDYNMKTYLPYYVTSQGERLYYQ